MVSTGLAASLWLSDCGRGGSGSGGGGDGSGRTFAGGGRLNSFLVADMFSVVSSLTSRRMALYWRKYSESALPLRDIQLDEERDAARGRRGESVPP